MEDYIEEDRREEHEYRELLKRIYKETSEHGYLSFYLMEDLKHKLHEDEQRANMWFG